VDGSDRTPALAAEAGMTILRDRLPGSIRFKKKFAPSPERVRIARNTVIVVTMVVLGYFFLSLLFGPDPSPLVGR
jgi:hypothetical protein